MSAHKYHCHALHAGLDAAACTCGLTVSIATTGLAEARKTLVEWNAEYARQLTDDQLRAEIARRRIVAAPTFEQMKQLNAEHDAAIADLGGLNREIAAQRDDYKKLFDGACARLEDTKASRDGWRARAEVAEAQCAKPVGLLDQCRVNGVTFVATSGANPDHYEQSQDCRERGHGIADRNGKPDNSVAWLDEDLLCEDA